MSHASMYLAQLEEVGGVQFNNNNPKHVKETDRKRGDTTMKPIMGGICLAPITKDRLSRNPKRKTERPHKSLLQFIGAFIGTSPDPMDQ